MAHLLSNLKHLRKSKAWTQQEMAAKLGIPRPTYSGWERGSAEPSLKSLNQLTDIYNVSLDALVNDDLAAGGVERQVTDQFRVLAISVDDHNRELIDFVPVKAEAGYIEQFADPGYIEALDKISIPGLPEGSYRAFEINGESMLPLEPGSIVIASYVERLSYVRPGLTYILITNDAVVYKRLYPDQGDRQSFIAMSDNPAYAPYTVSYEEVGELWQYHCHVAFSDQSPRHETDVSLRLHAIEQIIKS